MGFYIRKALKVGPLRFKLSKSGVGVSAGVKGLRLGTGPRGNYVHMGRGGLYFRKSLIFACCFGLTQTIFGDLIPAREYFSIRGLNRAGYSRSVVFSCLGTGIGIVLPSGIILL